MGKQTVYLDDYDEDIIKPGEPYAQVSQNIIGADGAIVKVVRSVVAERNFDKLPAGVEGKPRGRKPAAAGE